MKFSELSSVEKNAFEQVLGYINFSSGSHDPAFYSNLKTVTESIGSNQGFLYQTLQAVLLTALNELNGDTGVLSTSEQARTAIELTFSHVIPQYLSFHDNVLHDHDEEQINETVNTFFIGRVLDVVLKLKDEWENPIFADHAVHNLNDYV